MSCSSADCRVRSEGPRVDRGAARGYESDSTDGKLSSVKMKSVSKSVHALAVSWKIFLVMNQVAKPACYRRDREPTRWRRRASRLLQRRSRGCVLCEVCVLCDPAWRRRDQHDGGIDLSCRATRRNDSCRFRSTDCCREAGPEAKPVRPQMRGRKSRRDCDRDAWRDKAHCRHRARVVRLSLRRRRGRRRPRYRCS